MRKTKKIMTAVLAAATLAGGFAFATESSAQSRRYYRDRDNSGAAVAAGIAGLALGAALAGNNRSYGYGGYGGGYYAPSYGYGYGYAQPYSGRGYYDRGYYGPPRRAYRARTCTYWEHDRWGRAYRVRGRC